MVCSFGRNGPKLQELWSWDRQEHLSHQSIAYIDFPGGVSGTGVTFRDHSVLVLSVWFCKYETDENMDMVEQCWTDVSFNVLAEHEKVNISTQGMSAQLLFRLRSSVRESSRTQNNRKSDDADWSEQKYFCIWINLGVGPMKTNLLLSGFIHKTFESNTLCQQ